MNSISKLAKATCIAAVFGTLGLAPATAQEVPKMKMATEIPEGVIGGIEYAENQLAFEEATNGLENARKQFDDRPFQTADEFTYPDARAVQV